MILSPSSCCTASRSFPPRTRYRGGVPNGGLLLPLLREPHLTLVCLEVKSKVEFPNGTWKFKNSALTVVGRHDFQRGNQATLVLHTPSSPLAYCLLPH